MNKKNGNFSKKDQKNLFDINNNHFTNINSGNKNHSEIKVNKKKNNIFSTEIPNKSAYLSSIKNSNLTDLNNDENKTKKNISNLKPLKIPNSNNKENIDDADYEESMKRIKNFKNVILERVNNDLKIKSDDINSDQNLAEKIEEVISINDKNDNNLSNSIKGIIQNEDDQENINKFEKYNFLNPFLNHKNQISDKESQKIKNNENYNINNDSMVISIKSIQKSNEKMDIVKPKDYNQFSPAKSDQLSLKPIKRKYNKTLNEIFNIEETHTIQKEKKNKRKSKLPTEIKINNEKKVFINIYKELIMDKSEQHENEILNEKEFSLNKNSNFENTKKNELASFIKHMKKSIPQSQGVLKKRKRPNSEKLADSNFSLFRFSKENNINTNKIPLNLSFSKRNLCYEKDSFLNKEINTYNSDIENSFARLKLIEIKKELFEKSPQNKKSLEVEDLIEKENENNEYIFANELLKENLNLNELITIKRNTSSKKVRDNNKTKENPESLKSNLENESIKDNISISSLSKKVLNSKTSFNSNIKNANNNNVSITLDEIPNSKKFSKEKINYQNEVSFVDKKAREENVSESESCEDHLEKFTKIKTKSKLTYDKVKVLNTNNFNLSSIQDLKTEPLIKNNLDSKNLKSHQKKGKNLYEDDEEFEDIKENAFRLQNNSFLDTNSNFNDNDSKTKNFYVNQLKDLNKMTDDFNSINDSFEDSSIFSNFYDNNYGTQIKNKINILSSNFSNSEFQNNRNEEQTDITENKKKKKNGGYRLDSNFFKVGKSIKIEKKNTVHHDDGLVKSQIPMSLNNLNPLYYDAFQADENGIYDDYYLEEHNQELENDLFKNLEEININEKSYYKTNSNSNTAKNVKKKNNRNSKLKVKWDDEEINPEYKFFNKFSLKDYQKELLSWIEEKSLGKFGSPKGGIISLPMGAGKTFSTLCKVMYDYNKTKRPSMIIVPKAILSVWTEEIEKFFPKSEGMYAVLFENKPSLLNKFTIDILKKVKVIITTYPFVLNMSKKNNFIEKVITRYNERIISIDCRRVPRKEPDYSTLKGDKLLFEFVYENIICDESHKFSNIKSSTFLSLMYLISKKKWCLTGNIIMNKKDDIKSQLMFLGMKIYQIEEIEDYMNYIFYRPNLHTLIELPGKEIFEEVLPFSKEEQAFYNYYRTSYKKAYERNYEAFEQISCMLVVIMRFRQICIHPLLLNSNKESNGKAQGTIDFQKIQDEIEISIPLEVKHWLFNGLNKETSSTKIIRAVEIVKKIPNDEKIIIFSFFKETFTQIELYMKLKGFNINYVKLTNGKSQTEREIIIERFRNDPTVKILFLTFSLGSYGLNLFCANNIIMMDLWWNFAVYDQSIARVYRNGQVRPVNVWVLMIENSIDFFMKELIEEKREILLSMTQKKPIDKDRKRTKLLFERVLYGDQAEYQ